MLPNVFIFTEEFKNPHNTYFPDPVVPDPLPSSLQNYPPIQTSEIAPNTTLEKNIPSETLQDRTSAVFQKLTKTSLWTEEETDELRRAVDECKNPNGSICWKEVATRLKKTARACREKYKRLKISKPSECYWSKRQIDALNESIKIRKNKKGIIWKKVVEDMQGIRPGNKKTFKSRYYEWDLANGGLENQEQRGSANSQDDQVNAKSTETTDKEVSKVKTSKKRKKSSKSKHKIKTKKHSAKKAKVNKDTHILADELEAFLTDNFQPENEQNNKTGLGNQEKCSSTNANSTETKDREASKVKTSKKRKKTSKRKHKTKSTKSKHSAKKAKVDRSSKINAQTIAEELEASLTVAPSSELETEPGEKNPKWLKEHTIFLEKILKTSFSPKTKINWKWVAKRFYYLHGIKFKHLFLVRKGLLITNKKTAKDLENEANSQQTRVKKFIWSEKTRKRLVKLVERYWHSKRLWAKIELKFNDHKTDLPFVPRQNLQKKYNKIRNNKISNAKKLTPPNPDNNPVSVSLQNQEGGVSQEPQTVVVYKDLKGFWSSKQNEAFERIVEECKDCQGKVHWSEVEKAMKNVKPLKKETLKRRYARDHPQLGDRPNHELWWTEEQINALVVSAIKHANKAEKIVWREVALDLKTIRPHTSINGFKDKYGRISPEIKERIRLAEMEAEELAKEKENACPTPEVPPTQNYAEVVVSTPYSIEASASPIQNTNSPYTNMTPFFAELEDSEGPLASLNSLGEDWI